MRTDAILAQRLSGYDPLSADVKFRGVRRKRGSRDKLNLVEISFSRLRRFDLLGSC